MTSLLFSIDLRHQYYANGSLQNASLIAGRQTQALLDRYGFIARLEQGVYSIIKLGNQKLSESLASITQAFGDLPLRFHIQADAQNFLLISDLPIDKLSLLSYSSANADPQPSQALRLKPLLDQRDDLERNRVAEISIYPEDLLRTQIDDIPTRYEIVIDARKTQWNYFVFDSNNIKLRDPKVESNNGFEFESPSSVTIGDQHALHFSSGKHQFVLSEKPKHSCELLTHRKPLLDQDVGSSQPMKKLLKTLPSPTVNEISIQPGPNQNYACSQMYVYL